MIFNNLSDFEILKKSTTVVCQKVDNIIQQNQREIIHCIIMSNVLKVQKKKKNNKICPSKQKVIVVKFYNYLDQMETTLF